MLNEALDQPDGFQDLIEVEFPDSLEEAYEHVLHHDDVDPDTPLFLSHDSIETGYAPFFRCYDRNSPRKLIGYRRKPQFRSFQLVQLDPLNRFRFEPVSNAELFFHRWFASGNASRLGVFMEAAIACHAIHNEACFNCKCRRTLRWKGGRGNAWQDLVCTECQAIYEVKTKETRDHIQKALKYNQIPGGSFRDASRLESSRPVQHKRFLVLLPRNGASSPSA